MNPVGIDLGTTNSVVAAVVDGKNPKVLVGAAGEDAVVPSVVWFDRDRIAVGVEAKDQQAAGNPDVAAFFKRQMGDPDARVVIDGKKHTPIELSAHVLRRLKADAEHALGGPVKEAVVTVPAYFYDTQRAATTEAIELAGLKKLQLINEPTAAAIAFGVADACIDGHILVYDLGGGTFDVSVLKIKGKDIRVLTSEGDPVLGGKDWDQRIVALLASRFRDQHGIDPLADAEMIGDLYFEAEKAKKALSGREKTIAKIVHGGQSGAYELKRTEFESMTMDLADRTMGVVDIALDRVRVTTADIDRVLLVGGSTRMPMIRTILEKRFGRPPAAGVHPDHAVALGAAISAAAPRPKPAFSLGPAKEEPKFTLSSGHTISDVAPHSLGAIAESGDKSAYVNAIIIERDQPIPHTYRRRFRHKTRRGEDNLMEIFLTQGESESPASVKYLGRYVIPKVPHGRSNLTVVEVEYSYDRSGSLAVAASTGGAALDVRVDRLPDDVPGRFMRPPEKRVEHVTILLSFDLSGSMCGEPLAEAQRGARAFLSQIDLTHSSVGIIGHADWAEVVSPPSQNSKSIHRAIASLPSVNVGGANAQHPFDLAAKVLRDVTGPRVVVALADGMWQDQEVAIRSAKKLHASDVQVIALGFGSADESFLRSIASCEAGNIFTTLGKLAETMSTIAAVITETGDDSFSLGEPEPTDATPSLWDKLRGKR